MIFCFGQTGTGKTLTSVGSKDSERDFGFGPRIMEDLFKFKETSGKQVRVHLLLSCIETHRGYFTDLLQPHSGMMDHNCLKNVRAKKIRSASEGIVTLQRGSVLNIFVRFFFKICFLMFAFS